MSRYFLSQAADHDIENIFDFGVYRFGRNQAERYLLELDDCLTQLAKNPHLGRPRHELKQGLYSFSKRAHVLFYQVLPDHIKVIPVLHARQDIPGSINL
ncbi:type II toxin-antitoxin system RelE/ParE family toxin [Roseivirga sp.]|uniref:type II toxin-antitoxin system RelE/ParE family toxin n=1 Tax=Roseivirga sp. TaxID=1964215 RepID=UPI003B51FBD5